MKPRRTTILVVDDDEVSVMAIRRALERLEIRSPVVVASDGMAALDWLRSAARKPYVILLDINMPRMDGHEFLAALRADARLKDAVVFVMTTSDAPQDVDWAYARQVAGYIVKEDAYRSIRSAMVLVGIYVATVTLPS